MSAGEDTVARLRADLVQMEAERDAQAGQARRTVIDLQAVTAERDRLRGAIARHRRRMRNQVIPEVQGPDIELWSVLNDVDGDR